MGRNSKINVYLQKKAHIGLIDNIMILKKHILYNIFKDY